MVNVDDHTLLSYCRQVASGMAYLSSKDFVLVNHQKHITAI